jgi:hypothetical protein
MKQLLAIAACGVLLTACGGSHGLRDSTPKMSSRTTKDVPTYLECVRAKWSGSAEVNMSNKKEEGTLSASDKTGVHVLLNVTADGTGALVTMYERQSDKHDYNSAYRDAAVSCL